MVRAVPYRKKEKEEEEKKNEGICVASEYGEVKRHDLAIR